MEEFIESLQKEFGVSAAKIIPWAPDYAVSDDGRVFTKRRCNRNPVGSIRELKQSHHTHGYRYVRVCSTNGKSTSATVHRLLGELFLPPPSKDQKVVRHLNGDPADNSIANLAWGTQADNARDAVRHGRTLRGRKNPNAKLSDKTVMAIRLLLDEGFSPGALACFFGVDSETIRRCNTREQWGHVE